MYSIDTVAKTAFCTSMRKPGLLTKDLTRRADIREAVYDVYKSPSVIARRMTGRENVVVAPILNSIGDKIFEYFNGSPNKVLNIENYDEFFYKLCKEFKDGYNDLADRAQIIRIEFGIAQKLINMVFKYLSCYQNYIDFADLFMYCHLPIDSYVLHYFKVMGIVPGINSSFGAKMASPSANFNKSSWSKMPIELYKLLVCEYRPGLRMLYPDYTFLHQEYYIWSMVKTRSIGPIVFNSSPLLLGTKTKFKA